MTVTMVPLFIPYRIASMVWVIQTMEIIPYRADSSSPNTTTEAPMTTKSISIMA